MLVVHVAVFYLAFLIQMQLQHFFQVAKDKKSKRRHHLFFLIQVKFKKHKYKKTLRVYSSFFFLTRLKMSLNPTQIGRS